MKLGEFIIRSIFVTICVIVIVIVSSLILPNHRYHFFDQTHRGNLMNGKTEVKDFLGWHGE